MKSKIALLAILAITLAGTGVAFGTSATGTVNLTAEVTSIAELTLTNTTIDFPASNPRTTPTITGSASTLVSANVRTGSASTATLVAVAGGPLSDGTAADNIPISNVTSTYTATTGTGFFIAGTAIPMATGTGATLATGTSASGSYTGSFAWALTNSWLYADGNYGATISYTLTAP
jgi:hypothetical protein